jgi:TfoX/Sxy family transcriptional regulator of competence genes
MIRPPTTSAAGGKPDAEIIMTSQPALNLEDRIDRLSSRWRPVKMKMFGGAAYMINGNLAFGTHKKDQLIVRAGEEQAIALLKQPGIREFDMTGRPMKNWFMATDAAFKTERQLMDLLKTGYDFAKSLPPK